MNDLRHSLRMLRRSPGFTFAVVAALALGIGANTAIFSVVNTVLLKPLTYPDPDRLMVFTNTSPQGSGPGASPTKFNVWKQQTSAFQDVSGYRFNTVNLTGSSDPEQIAAGQVSADFFRLFGAPVAAGRTFSAAEDLPNGGHVAVLSEGFWKRKFGSDPTVVGRTISLNDDSYVVVGVLGPFDTQTIHGPGGPPDVWLPFQIDPNSAMQGHFFMAAGRFKPGVTAAVADAQLKIAAGEFAEQFPGALPPQGGFGAQKLNEIVVGNMRSSLLLLAGAVSFVLLIACANVANLLMVRATARRREIAIRSAIGAGRGRIVRQLLTESVLLSGIGGAVGLGLGLVGIRALLSLNPGNIPRVGVDGSGVTVDWRVLLFTAVVSIATGLLFGLFPALRASRTDLSTTLKEAGAQSSGGFRQNKARAVLVASEMSLALVLLVGAALLVRTFVALRAVEPGFDARQVLTMQMALTGGRFTRASAVGQLMREGAERLNALPGVEVAGATCCVPLQGGLGLPFVIEGRPLEGRFHGGGGFTPISPGYFSAFKIPMLRGRAFTDADTTGAPNVVIINQAMARQFWPNGDPLADRITIAKGLPELADPTRQIVGIVGDVRTFGLNREPQPVMYLPWAQLPDAHNANLVGIVSLSWIVRTRGEPTAMIGAVQNELRLASGGLPVSRPRTMGAIVTQSTARSDFNMLLLTIFAASALLLAAIGIYGLMAYSVQQRTQEIGIRLALGADARRVRNMVIGQGMRLALVGVVVGLAASFGLTRLLASFLFGVAARDPVVFVTVPLLLTGVALVGVWLPARRAARVDPVIALRSE
ncbi:MAG TPA: ABC transporter permease [Vicinamibacterales bacterium]|nr:ABC transporter permease [Vicinamibacterales bacterium]